MSDMSNYGDSKTSWYKKKGGCKETSSPWYKRGQKGASGKNSDARWYMKGGEKAPKPQ